MPTARVKPGMKRHLAAALLATVVLAGCASPGGTSPGSGQTSQESATPTISAAPSAPPSSATPSRTPPTSTAADITLHGTITQGAEPSCKLITDQKVEYLLLAADSVVIPPVGSGAVVTGHVEHGIMTHCQQGIPFAVTTISAQ